VQRGRTKTQVVTGQVSARGAVAVPRGQRRQRHRAAQLRSDGSFTLTLPSGNRYRLEVLTASGVKHIYARETTGLHALAFKFASRRRRGHRRGQGARGSPNDNCDPTTDPNCQCDATQLQRRRWRGLRSADRPNCGGGGGGTATRWTDPKLQVRRDRNCNGGCTIRTIRTAAAAAAIRPPIQLRAQLRSADRPELRLRRETATARTVAAVAPIRTIRTATAVQLRSADRPELRLRRERQLQGRWPAVAPIRNDPNCKRRWRRQLRSDHRPELQVRPDHERLQRQRRWRLAIRTNDPNCQCDAAPANNCGSTAPIRTIRARARIPA